MTKVSEALNKGARKIAATGRGSRSNGGGGVSGIGVTVLVLANRRRYKGAMTDGADARAGRMIMRGAQATALGFAVRFAARLLFLFVAGRLYGARLFGVYVLATAMVELAVGAAGLSTKKTLFPLLDREEAAGRPPAHA